MYTEGATFFGDTLVRPCMVSPKCRVYMLYKRATSTSVSTSEKDTAQPCLFPKLHERSDLIALVCQRSRCAVPRAIASPRWMVPPVLLPVHIHRAQNSESRDLIGRIAPITALHFSEFLARAIDSAVRRVLVISLFFGAPCVCPAFACCLASLS